LKNVDRFGQLAGAPGAAAELSQDAPELQLGVGAFWNTGEPGCDACRPELSGCFVTII
jgi:hypothetical protein